jgi:multidrug efflux pump
MNTTPAVIVNIQRQPSANTIAVVDRITTLLPQLADTLPPAVHVSVLTIARRRFVRRWPMCSSS